MYREYSRFSYRLPETHLLFFPFSTFPRGFDLWSYMYDAVLSFIISSCIHGKRRTSPALKPQHLFILSKYWNTKLTILTKMRFSHNEYLLKVESFIGIVFFLQSNRNVNHTPRFTGFYEYRNLQEIF